MAADQVAASKRPASVNAALEAWIGYLAQERRASPRTLESYRYGVSTYLDFLERHWGETLALDDLAKVSTADVRAFLAARRQGAGDGQGLSPRSLSQNLSAVRAFHKWLDRRLGIANDAVALVRGPKIKASVPRPVSEDQARGLLREAADDVALEPWEAARDAAVLTLLYGCGLRISEALSLTRADAPLGETLRITGKGGKTRIAPVLPAVRVAVDEYLLQVAPSPFRRSYRCFAPSAEGRYRLARCRRPWPSSVARWACRIERRRTPYAIPSPRISWAQAPTSAPFRNCLATPPSPPPRNTRRWMLQGLLAVYAKAHPRA